MPLLKKKQIKHSLERIKPIIEEKSELLEFKIDQFAYHIRTLSVQLTNNGIDADLMQAFILHGIGVQIAKIKEKEVKKDV